jgi:hypothetical protein
VLLGPITTSGGRLAHFRVIVLRRYLREIVTPLIQHRISSQFGSTATIGLLADTLEGREPVH